MQTNLALQHCATLLAWLVMVKQCAITWPAEQLQLFLHMQLQQLRMTLQEDGITPTISDKIIELLAICADEFALQHVRYAEPSWIAQPLQQQLGYGEHGGERFFEIITLSQAQPIQYLVLAQLASHLLQLGFKGKYYNQGDTQCVNIITQLNQLVRTLQPTSNALVTQRRQINFVTQQRLRHRRLLVGSLLCTVLLLLISQLLMLPQTYRIIEAMQQLCAL